jgi:hypothetical protein
VGITVIVLGIELDDVASALKSSPLLRPLSTGPTRWRRGRGRREITSSVLGDAADRDRIALALIGLDLTYKPGITSIKLGDFSEAYGQGARSYPDERAAIFASYFAEQGGFI